MPNLDKTGPAGKGAQTGRGLGDCADDKKDDKKDYKVNKGTDTKKVSIPKSKQDTWNPKQK